MNLISGFYSGLVSSQHPLPTIHRGIGNAAYAAAMASALFVLANQILAACSRDYRLLYSYRAYSMPARA